MTGGSGLGVLERHILSAVAHVAGGAGGYARTAAVLTHLEDRYGTGARYARPVLRDLLAPGRVHLPLLLGTGAEPPGCGFGCGFGCGCGRPGGGPGTGSGVGVGADRTPLAARVRLSPVGALALEAERGDVGPVPFGIIEGSLYRGGCVPPFSPRDVVDALLTGARHAGPPLAPAGGPIEGDVDRLLSGRRARLVLGCTLRVERSALVITGLPLGARPAEVIPRIVDRVNAMSRWYTDQYPDRALARLAGRGPDDDPGARLNGRSPGAGPRAHAVDGLPAPVIDLSDESTRDAVRIVLALRAGADPGASAAWLRSIHPLTVAVDCRLPAPMHVVLARWDRGDGTGLDALAAHV